MTALLSNSEILPWRVFSTQSAWEDFRMDEYRWPPMQLPPQKHEQHIIRFNMGTPVQLAWRSSGQWHTCECNTDNIISILPAGQTEEIGWEEELHVFTITLQSTYVDRLLEVDGFMFTEQQNLNNPFLRQLCLTLYHTSKTGLSTDKILIESLIVTLVIYLSTQYAGNGKKIFAPKGKLSAGQLRKVIDYVRDFIHTDIGLAEMASSAHLSPFHFSRLFRHTLGISPYQFVLQMKIGHAKKMIADKRGSLSEIAYTLNFTDQAHFSNVFKKVTGICPRHFMHTCRV